MILKLLPIALNHFPPNYLQVLEGEAGDPGTPLRAVTTHGGAGRESWGLAAGGQILPLSPEGSRQQICGSVLLIPHHQGQRVHPEDGHIAVR